jgi:ketosteroid isomerase-like protein
MSQENVEFAKAVFEALNRGDREKAICLAHPEIVLDATRSVFNPKTYVGRDGLRQWLADTDDVWEGMHTEQNEVIDAGDRVVVIGRLVGKGKGSGVEVGRPNATVLTIRDGLLIRSETGYTSRREALEAVGLSEQDARADS